jgi:hypothetical protein
MRSKAPERLSADQINQARIDDIDLLVWLGRVDEIMAQL